MRFTVIHVLWADHTSEVDADTPEEAAEREPDTSLCHRCARVLNVADLSHTIVLDEHGVELINTSDEATS